MPEEQQERGGRGGGDAPENVYGRGESGRGRRGGMSPARVQGYLKGLEYPASKARLLERARANHAPEDIVDALERVTEGEYQRVVDVTREIGRLSPPGRRGSDRPSPAHVLSYLRGIAFPATRGALVEMAERQGAPAEVMSALERLADRQYVRVVEISKEIGRLR